MAAAPTPTPRRGPPWGLLLGVGGLIGVTGIAGTLALALLWEDDSIHAPAPTGGAPTSLAPAAVDAASAIPDAGYDGGFEIGIDAGVGEDIADLVEIRVDVRPRHARLFWDGEPIEGTVIRVPRSEELHTLRGVARDYLDGRRQIAPFDSQTVELRLRRRPWPSF